MLSSQHQLSFSAEQQTDLSAISRDTCKEAIGFLNIFRSSFITWLDLTMFMQFFYTSSSLQLKFSVLFHFAEFHNTAQLIYHDHPSFKLLEIVFASALNAVWRTPNCPKLLFFPCIFYRNFSTGSLMSWILLLWSLCFPVLPSYAARNADSVWSLCCVLLSHSHQKNNARKDTFLRLGPHTDFRGTILSE